MPKTRSQTLRPQPISASSTINRSEPYLRVSLDYGTRYASAHSQLVTSGYNAQTAPIRPVLLKRYDGPEVKQVAMYHKDGSVIYGNRDVARYLLTSQDPQSASQILEFVKMASIPEFKHSTQVRRVREILHGKDDTGYLRDFLCDHFFSIFRDIRACHKNRHPDDDKYATAIELLPLELQLPVPVMMDDDGRADFRAAAILAGATEVELREEPLCVATAYMPELVRNGDVKKGQCVLIVDIGGMTADFATTKLLEAPEFGDPEFRMQRVGQCHGNGAGSCFLNTQIIQSLLQRPDLQQCLESLEIEEYHLLQQLSNWFDDVKRDINIPAKHEFVFVAHSSHGQSGVEGRSHHWSFSFSRDAILEFYSNWIAKIKEELQIHLITKLKETFAGVIMVGGGSRSVMLQEEIELFLTPHGIRILELELSEPPCSRGGLTQHFFEKDALPDVCFWYTSRVEEYCRTEHPDAELHENLRESIYWPQSTALEFSGPDSNATVVRDRLVEIKRYSAHRGFEPKRKQRLLLEVSIIAHDDPEERKRGRLDVPLFWSETAQSEHAPVYTPQGQRVDGLRSYTVRFDLPEDGEFELQGFHRNTPPGEDPYYLAYVFVDMQGDAFSLVMNATVMKANFTESSKGLQFRHDLAWFSLDPQTIWTPTSSHFVSQFTSTKDVQSRFKTQGEVLAGEPASGEAPTINAGSHPSGNLDNTGDSTRQSPRSPATSRHDSQGKNIATAARRPRNRSRESSQERSHLTHPTPDSLRTPSPAYSSIISRQLQELEEHATAGASPQNRTHETTAPVGRSLTPGARPKRNNRITGMATGTVLRQFE